MSQAQLVYDQSQRTLRTTGGNLLMTDVSLDEAGEAFLGTVIHAIRTRTEGFSSAPTPQV